MNLKIILLALALTAACGGYALPPRDGAGYKLWLDYMPVQDLRLHKSYAGSCLRIHIADNRFAETIRSEFTAALGGMLGRQPSYTTRARASLRLSLTGDAALKGEGYKIRSTPGGISIEARSDAGLLYGAFHLIRLMQCRQTLDGLDITEIPRYDMRHVNHWDDMDGYVERGYAGRSLWRWDELPGVVCPRYADYARANASIGINGVVVNNVNADPRFLRRDYLEKLAALADVFRRYNIRIYLAANFASPLKPSSTPSVMKMWGGVGDLDTADPADSRVQRWWRDKADQIYGLIPDFGGFLVKANSEGMPGPQDYGRSHADGANMLARALKPHGGVVMWRTFVYDPGVDPDRLKRPYIEFTLLDGRFDDNVILQAKNGPLDFQPIEPVQPLFGAMERTPLMPELQITQEYTGQSTYLVYLLPMWRAFFDFDTFCRGRGSTVASLTQGAIYPQRMTAIAGVANAGDAPNWTGHHFAQANWYAFGRLAWDPAVPSSEITRQWIVSTWHTDDASSGVIEQMMMPSRESFTATHSPYGLGLTVKVADHYTAGFGARAGKEWRADKAGIGYDRTLSGSGYVAQYRQPNRSEYNDVNACPEELLLCFHYVPWNHKMKSGATLREEFFDGLAKGVGRVRANISLWESVKDKIDTARYREVMRSLQKEQQDAEAFYREAHRFFTDITK